MKTRKPQSGIKKSEKIRIEIRELPPHLIEKALFDLFQQKALAAPREKAEHLSPKLDASFDDTQKLTQ
ncbi:hypothetical protein ACFOQM_13720 [Paenibacillus sp. GCM10012307]|uniref:Uncharacterized protein n=1 Tax=Paenibacillus roseus TaxID=2798579 RepID=A0A934MQY0_9BACL|nr:hypothetical protein [Paenibacillus roseus]MBJ6362348.1 hypothetical protein [Paenibacillus roseus]